jgi:hypothetical protein
MEKNHIIKYCAPGAVQGDNTDFMGSEAECDTDDDLAHAPRARNNAVHVRTLLYRDHDIKCMPAVLGLRLLTARAVWLHVMPHCRRKDTSITEDP